MCKPTTYNSCSDKSSLLQTIVQAEELYLLYIFFGVTVFTALLMIIVFYFHKRKEETMKIDLPEDQEKQLLTRSFSKNRSFHNKTSEI